MCWAAAAHAQEVRANITGLVTDPTGAPVAQAVVVVTNVDDEPKAIALGADAYAQQPVQKEWLLATLRRLAGGGRPVIIVDDDEATRYVVRGLCRQLGLDPVEATDGAQALDRLRDLRAEAMLLDLVMPGLPGEEVLARLRSDPGTARLPVVITTSKVLAPGERERLESRRAVVLSKAQLSALDAPRVVEEALRRAAALAGADRPTTSSGVR